MASFVHIAEIAALLFVSYVAGWGVGYFARRLTARKPAVVAAIPAERLAVAMHETGDALVKAPVIEPVSTAPPPAAPERPASTLAAIDEQLLVTPVAAQPGPEKAPGAGTAVAPTAAVQLTPGQMTMVVETISEASAAPEPPAILAEAATTMAAEPAEPVLAEVIVAPFPTIEPLEIPVVPAEIVNAAPEAPVSAAPTDVFPEPVIPEEPPLAAAVAPEPAISAEQHAEPPIVEALIVEPPIVEEHALTLLAMPARHPGEAWSGEIKGRAAPRYGAPEPVLQVVSEPVPAVAPAPAGTTAPAPPATLAVPDEDAAMRAIEGGWSRRAARALPDKPELTDVGAAVAAAQVAVEQALAKLDADVVPPRKREGER